MAMKQGTSPPLSATWAALSIGTGLLCMEPVAAAQPEQSYRFLEALEMASPINKGSLSRFNRIGNIEPGTYSLDVFVNGSFSHRRSLRLDLFEGQGAAACFKAEDAALLNLRPDLIARLGQRECARIDELAAGAQAVLDLSNLRINVSIPQSQLKHVARGYIDPELYDAGETMGFLNYSISQYYSRTAQARQDATYGFTHSGLNLGLWRLRQQGSLAYDKRNGLNWNPVRTYAKRALPDWTSELTVGENFTSGNLLSGLAYQGIELSSDERMLPDSLRGYAPVIRGTARSNAQVIVHQKGREIYRTTVAPGNFIIDDLYPTSYNGDLDVTVIEADGSRANFSVPFSALPESMRPGRSRYSLTLGRTRDTDTRALFMDALYQRGLSNAITANLGTRLAWGYQSAVLGTTLAGPLGSLGLALNYSHAASGRNTSGGWMLGLSYSHTFDATGTHFSIASYRYSTAGYRELADVLSERLAWRTGTGNSALGNSTSYQQHSRFDLSLSQQLGSAGSLYLSGLTQTFYHDRSRITQLQFGYSTMRSNGMSINLAFQRQQLSATPGAPESISGLLPATARPGSSIMLSLSIPLGKQGGQGHALSTSLVKAEGQDLYQSQVSGMLPGAHQLNYSLGTSHAPGGQQDSINGNLGAGLPKAHLNVNLTRGRDYWQAALNARGALAVHDGGITFGPYLGDTFALVEAKGAQGAKLFNGQGAVIDDNGFALLPSLSPYHRNVVELASTGANQKSEILESQRIVIPYAGATLKLSFRTRAGHAMLIRLHRENGEPLPMGADVLDEQGEMVGMVGQGSQAYLRSDRVRAKLLVRWGDGQQERCAAQYDLQGQDLSSPLLRLTANCIAAPRREQFLPADASRPDARSSPQ
ncbi:fimbria/pilus outer membrane usher protein [Herbaspirillum rubrisubalbicans]|uniref:Fimbrial biogenesis outer membrane usher protein n=1 Tax=Herbaspirillum rubrisubalbicans TaxID=80842 RepID=A0AAD0U7I8_9BURK|nr:fimbria/pilus outer membrane usher protein [Herbaspirillum rubrisubalbicans]AYR23701.1 fimbrial biogenesis outer membrane usher protein [Herbaspirillum rubrisubalbicans]